jgi:hypothetical protein
LGVLAIAFLTLAFFLTGYACGAIEISVPVMKMGYLSVDLGPDYVFKEGNDSNPSGLGVEIDNIKDPEVKNAIVIVSPKDKSMDTVFLGSIVMAILELGGAEETNNMTLTDSNGQNVTLHVFNTTESMATKGEEMFFALWDMDPMNSCSLISTLDEETTKKIVETLAIKA